MTSATRTDTAVRSNAVRLYAAGSLKAALAEVANAYEAGRGQKIVGTFGPSGLLKDQIDDGAQADIFCSANMEHPQALHDANLSGPVVLFARNILCALVRPDLDVDSAGLLARMLDPAVKLATSTPKADPSGDYAFACFAKTDQIKPGMRKILEAKALQLTGNKASRPPPDGGNVYGWHVAQGHADIFLTYRSNALAAQKQYPGQKSVMLPEALAVGADYGLTVIKGAPAGATTFAQFIVSSTGQAILARHGFAPLSA